MLYDFFGELKETIKEFFKNIYIKFKYILLLIILIILIACIFLCKIENPINIETQQLMLFGITIENWSQWITIITIPFTAGWAIFQFRKNSLAKKQEKAVQIGREFSQNLINKCGIINEVYKGSSLNTFFKFTEKSYEDFHFFNVDELRKIYKNDNFPTEFLMARENALTELDEIYHEILLKKVNPYNNKKFNINLQENRIESIDEIIKNEDPFILQNQGLPYHFADLESEVLNQLEYLCMDISSRATDSKFIYQSLHQMFLRTVRTLAVRISIYNNCFSDKYYTNIIHVYNDWTSRYMKDLKIEKRKKDKINKILNPKIKTV